MADENLNDPAAGGSRIVPINIEEEMKSAYIDYSMSVIVSRALPDVRDGMKPVHRRVLFGMLDLGVLSNRPYKKSARIVGEVLGKYHPHGDSSVYDAMVRMAQDWSLRYPLVDGQGNFGSMEGDSPAAMRYTEARLKKTAEEMLSDIDKDTIDFRLNFDDSLQEPTVLPARIPNLLVNGAAGIAVGMATNMAPHNLTEVINGIMAYIDNRDIDVAGLMQYVKAPDFPTGGIIYGYEGVKDAFETGRGRIVIRAKTNIETLDNGKEQIVVTEVPYQVNPAEIQIKAADLVRGLAPRHRRASPGRPPSRRAMHLPPAAQPYGDPRRRRAPGAPAPPQLAACSSQTRGWLTPLGRRRSGRRRARPAPHPCRGPGGTCRAPRTPCVRSYAAISGV